jgi:hypothetical protein
VGIKYKVLMVLVVIALMLIPLSCVQPQAGIAFEFIGGGVTCEPATETMVQIAIAHTCEVNDELILEKVEIYGEGETPVKVFEVNKTLNSVSGKQKRLDELVELLESGMEDEAKYEEIGQEAAKLAQEMRDESFSTGYFTLDLRQLKQSLMVGDKIPIIARATLIHNGNLLTLERNVTAEYQACFPGSH